MRLRARSSGNRIGGVTREWDEEMRLVRAEAYTIRFASLAPGPTRVAARAAALASMGTWACYSYFNSTRCSGSTRTTM